MKKLFTLGLIFISLVTLAQNNVTISGTIKNNTGFTKILLMELLDNSEIASAPIATSDAFKISAKINKTDFYKLFLDEDIYILLVLEAGENLEVVFDVNDVLKPEIKGSKNSALIYNTLNEARMFDDQLVQFQQKIEVDKKNHIRNTIKNNPKSLANLFFIDELNIETDFETFKLLAEGLEEYADNKLVADLIAKVKSQANLSIGSLAPDFELPDVNGKSIKLSSTRGKYVLIDFWAAWCKPCRAESPTLVKAYEKFNKNGFTILSVSLDDNKEDWTTAIQKDKIGAWIHVSDLQYWNSEAAKLYGVESIPFSVLLDKEGKIIAKGLRGEELISKLNELFSK